MKETAGERSNIDIAASNVSPPSQESLQKRMPGRPAHQAFHGPEGKSPAFKDWGVGLGSGQQLIQRERAGADAIKVDRELF
ncbi:hypothetical protein [Mesorhizobium sp. WSM2239]|uniref:Uncharacterized protein n=2 Tax=unclassified Mesorhizobium TaxID=325217 RepID=A0AAU8DCE7_9HYPH